MCLERGLPEQSQTSAMVDVKDPDPGLRSHVYLRKFEITVKI